MTNKAKYLAAGCGLITLACVLIYGCYYIYNYSTYLYFNGIKTTGVVIDYQTYKRISIEPKDLDTYYPVVEYTSDRGVEITATNKTGSSEQPYSIDSKVEIYYNPFNPRELIIYSFVDLFLAIIGLSFGAVVLITIGGILMGGSRKYKNQH
ncbi:DUF3592 domain-containing protein [Endozoicomonas sp. SM1973]|uniref:DUF3592 domain-containing protein n=1 Tax=Spartinivicinus marinus TaxID=2994442 RepID=A0A853II76_9GAMM|nr:DUF3592 domain-containing protein [Spartinivicinus marinus]MCX4028222.1 DUF3592 domain-containing protein [Spartinivicinus marinus]NYZ69734.1 DUF3592 domain-containing protein [Spartinivicinus marinus]